jgi:hypothetical protein
MRQRRWLELIKDYDIEIHYHPGKANVVADALSGKSYCDSLVAKERLPKLHEEFDKLRIEACDSGYLNTLQVTYTLEDKIRSAQKSCKEIKKIKSLMQEGKAQEYKIDEQGTLWLKNRLCVPQDQQIHESILSEAHNSRYSIHPGCTKMYCDLRDRFWWTDMKSDIIAYVARCDTCQRVKAEHQRPAGLLQPLDILVWKWEDISMDFIVGLPRSQKGHDSIWVIVDRLTKVAHFIPVKTSFTTSKLVDLYIDNILCLHGAPKTIVSDRGPQFTTKF